MSILKEPTEEGKRNINLKTTSICLKLFSETSAVEVTKRPSRMIEAFEEVLKSELSQAWVREEELKEQVDNLKKQIK